MATISSNGTGGGNWSSASTWAGSEQANRDLGIGHGNYS